MSTGVLFTVWTSYSDHPLEELVRDINKYATRKYSRIYHTCYALLSYKQYIFTVRAILRSKEFHLNSTTFSVSVSQGKFSYINT